MSFKIFTYWHDHKKIPDYINLCFDTMKKHNDNVVIYDQNSICKELNISKYHPILHIRASKRPQILEDAIPFQATYFRVRLLEKYGGMWLDADTIVFKNLEKLVGNVFTGRKTVLNYIGNAFIGAKEPGNQILKEYAIRQDFILRHTRLINTSLWGAKVLTKIINDGNHDIEYHTKEVAPIEWQDYKDFFKCDVDVPDCHCALLYNRLFPMWFKNMTRDAILKQDLLISKMFRKALR